MHLSELIRPYWPLLALLAVVLFVAIVLPGKRGATEVPKARRPMSEREQAMFFRLQSALPEHIVLAQVSFGALLEAKSFRARNTFSQKIADFVVCSKAFGVVAVIELDDASHKNKREKDAKRDQLLQKAGYKTLRFKNVPDAAEIKAVFAQNTAKEAPVLP